jgi:hypothetical protein
MPENKKTFKVGSEVYDIEETQVSEFLKDVPDAVEVKSFVVDKDTFDIPINDVGDFLKDVPNAKPLFSDISAEGMQARKGGMREALGKIKAVPSQSSDGGSAMKVRKTDLQYILPKTLPKNSKIFLVDEKPVVVDGFDRNKFIKENPEAREAIAYNVNGDTVVIPIEFSADFLISTPNVKPLYEEDGSSNIEDIMKGFGKPIEKKSSEPSKSNEYKPMGVELSGTLPTTLKAEDVQGQVEEFAGGELANIDYEKAAEKLRGQNPIQAALKNTETIENPVEKLAAKQDIYKAASSQYTLNNEEIDTQLSQLRQGYSQVASDFEANKAQYDELVASGDEQGAALIYPVLKEMQDNINWMAEQQKSLVTKFNDNARAISTINAGRAAEYKIAKDKGELNTSLPRGVAPFLNLLGANVQFSPDDAFTASAWNAIAPNIVRSLAAATQMNPLGVFGVYDGVEESLLNVADAIEVDTRKYIPKDKAVSFLDDLNMYNGSELIGSLVGSVAGTLGGGGINAAGSMAFNAAQGFGGMYGWGREAGLTQEQALLVAAPVGLIYGYLGDKGVEAMSSMIAKPSVKKIILEEIKSLGSNPTKNQLLEVFGKALGNATKGAAREGFQEVGEFTSEFLMKLAADEAFDVKEKYAKELTLDNFKKGAAESFVGGAFGGSVFGALFGAESGKTYSDVVAEAVNDPIVEEEFRSELNQLLLSNKLTQEQFDQSVASLEKAKEVNAKIPANVTNVEARSEAITLIQEKEQLTAEIENIEPAMAKPMVERVASIDQRLSDIAEGKSETTVEDIQQQQEGLTSIEQPVTPNETIDLTPKEKVSDVIPKEISDLYSEAATLRFTLNALEQQMGGRKLVGKSKIEYENTKKRLDDIEFKLSEYDKNKSIIDNPNKKEDKEQVVNESVLEDSVDSEYGNYLLNEIDKRHKEKYNGEDIKTGLAKSFSETLKDRGESRAISNLEDVYMNYVPLGVRAEAYQAIRKNFEKSKSQPTKQPTSEVSPSSVDKGEVAVIPKSENVVDGVVTVKVKLGGFKEVDAPVLSKYKGYDIVMINNDVAIYDPKEETLVFVALDDTKSTSNKRFNIEDANNLEIAKKQIDLTLEMRGRNKKSKTINLTPITNEETNEANRQELLGIAQESGNENQRRQSGERLQTEIQAEEITKEKRISELNKEKLSLTNKAFKQFPNSKIQLDTRARIDEINKELKQLQDATKEGKIEQGRESEYQGTDGQQQGGQENRVNQEGDVAQAEIITGGGNIAEQSGAVQEEVNLKPSEQLKSETNKLFEELENLGKAYVNESKLTSLSKESKLGKAVNSIDGLITKLENDKSTYLTIPYLKQIVVKALKIFRDSIIASGEIIDAFSASYKLGLDEIYKDPEYVNASEVEKNAIIEFFNKNVAQFKDSLVKGKEATSRFGKNIFEGLKKEGKVSNRVLNQMAADKQYDSRNQDDVTNAAIELVNSLDGDVDAINEVANSPQINLDFKAALLAQVLGKAKADLDANDSPENQKAFLDARNALQQLATNIGQGESYFNKIYELFPEFKVDAFKKKIDSAAKSSVGTNRNNPSSALAKAMNVAEKTPKIKNDVFNAIGRLFTGTTTLKDSKNLSNAKTKAALRTLLAFGDKIGAEGKDLYKKLIDDAINNGKQEVFGQREEVKAKVLANLKDVNGRIKQPLSDADLEKAAEAFTELYEDLATKAIKKEIDRSFADKKKTISGDKNSKVAKLILYGALDEETTRAKFAEKFGIPYITPEQTAKLEQLANNVKNSKGGAKKAATTQLNNYMNKLAANSSFSQRFSSNVKERFVDISAYIINNILFNPATQAAAITGNTLRAFTKASEMAIKGRFDILTYTFNQTLNKEVTLPNGEVIKLDLGRVKNAVAASLAGIPRLSEYKLQGISRQEQKIRDAKTPLERALRTIFLGSAQRLLSAIDASVTPIISSITQYQLVEQMVKDLYIKSGLPIPNKANIQNDVRAIIGFDETQLDAIAEQAYNDVISSPYYNQLVAEGRIDPNKPFPTSAYGLNPNSGEVQLYNEFITRIYEIQSNGFNERFFDIQGRNGFDQTLDFSDQLREIDRYVARNTNEVAFFGRPVGIFGDMADVVSKASGIVPVLKYTGHFPLFINAAFNSAAYFVKMTPLINAVQLAKYKVTGSRGAYSLNADKEFETPYIVKLDQRNMTTAVLSSTILATSIAALLSNLYDTPEEEKEAWTKGNATGFIDNLTAGQKELLRDANGNPLQEGWFYKDGYPLFNYRITPYYGIFNAAAYFHNRDVFERDYFENKIFVEDNPEFKSVLADFMLSSVYMSLQTSSLSEVSKTLQTIVTKPSQKGESMSKKVSRDLEYKLSNLTSNLVPLGRAQKTLFNLYSSADGKNKKAATGFLDRVIMGSLYGDWAVKSNMTDFLGRPIKEAFTTKGLMLGVNTFEISNGEVRTFMDEAYENDEYAQLFLKRNYAPTSRHSINLPSRIELDGNVTDAEVEEVSLQLEEKGYKVKTQEASMLKEQSNFIEYTKVLDDREVNLVNEKSGGLVLSFLKADTNKRLLNDDTLTDYDFKQIMNSTYEYARQISMYEMFKDELGEGFSNMLMKKRDSYFKKMSNYGLVIPDEFEVK